MKNNGKIKKNCLIFQNFRAVEKTILARVSGLEVIFQLYESVAMYSCWPQDDHITVVFFPGFQLATGKKGRFLYDLVRAGSQPTLWDWPGIRLITSFLEKRYKGGEPDYRKRLPAIASGMDIVLLKVSTVVPKPFDAGTTRPISCSGHIVPPFGTPCIIFWNGLLFISTFLPNSYWHVLSLCPPPKGRGTYCFWYGSCWRRR